MWDSVPDLCRSTAGEASNSSESVGSGGPRRDPQAAHVTNSAAIPRAFDVDWLQNLGMIRPLNGGTVSAIEEVNSSLAAHDKAVAALDSFFPQPVTAESTMLSRPPPSPRYREVEAPTTDLPAWFCDPSEEEAPSAVLSAAFCDPSEEELRPQFYEQRSATPAKSRQPPPSAAN